MESPCLSPYRVSHHILLTAFQEIKTLIQLEWISAFTSIIFILNLNSLPPVSWPRGYDSNRVEAGSSPHSGRAGVQTGRAQTGMQVIELPALQCPSQEDLQSQSGGVGASWGDRGGWCGCPVPQVRSSQPPENFLLRLGPSKTSTSLDLLRSWGFHTDLNPDSARLGNGAEGKLSAVAVGMWDLTVRACFCNTGPVLQAWEFL